jgi:hypothetical protein
MLPVLTPVAGHHHEICGSRAESKFILRIQVASVVFCADKTGLLRLRVLVNFTMISHAYPHLNL